MRSSEVTGEVLAPLVREALGGGSMDAPSTTTRVSSRGEPLYRALLSEPLCVAHVGPGAPPGATIKLPDGHATRLVEAPALRVPVVPLYATGQALSSSAAERSLWTDGVERAEVLDKGAAFALLRGLPGALLVVDAEHALPLDAGEVAALADKQTPAEYGAAIRLLVEKNRGREAALPLSLRPLYVLGHPRGGLLQFSQNLPAFLHLAEAEAFANRIAEQTGERSQHGLVAASDIFKNAYRGKLNLVLNPGPGAITLRYAELRFG